MLRKVNKGQVVYFACFFAYICIVIIKKTKPYEKVFVIVACMSLHKCGDGAETI